jgi:hypothetical protein
LAFTPLRKRARSRARGTILILARACCLVVLPVAGITLTGVFAKSVHASNRFRVNHTLSQTRPTFGRVVFGAIIRDAPYHGLGETEAAAGRHLGIVELGQPFDRHVDEKALGLIHANGSLPMVTWYPWTYQYGVHGGNKTPLDRYALRKLADGTYDAVIRDEALRLAQFGSPVILRFAPEMNGFWYPWAEAPTGNIRGQYRNSNRLGDFVEAWRHVHDVFAAAGATNVIWDWSPNVRYYGQKYPFSEYYPGDRYVDLIGIDGYNWGGVKRWSKWLTPAEIFDRTLVALRGLGKRPFIISEVASTEVGGDKAAWIRQFFSYLRANRDIAAFLWFDFKKETDWRLASSPASELAFRTALGADVSGTATPLLDDLLVRKS